MGCGPSLQTVLPEFLPKGVSGHPQRSGSLAFVSADPMKGGFDDSPLRFLAAQEGVPGPRSQSHVTLGTGPAPPNRLPSPVQ